MSNSLMDNLLDNYVEEPWDIIQSYFRNNHLKQLVRHQIESYNDFVNNQISKTINMFNPTIIKSENDYDSELGEYKLEVHLSFKNFMIVRPQIHENNGATKIMFPNEARLRNFTYSSAMMIDIHIKYIIRNMNECKIINKVLSNIHIGKLPIMLKSSVCILNQYPHLSNENTGECKYDAGGYFIINGSEKTVIAQERPAENQVYCFKNKKGEKWKWSSEIKSIPEHKQISPKQITLYLSSKHNGFGYGIYVQLPRIKNPLPLFIIFRAIGVISDKNICEIILLNIKENKQPIMLNALQASIIDSNSCITQEDAIQVLIQNFHEI